MRTLIESLPGHALPDVEHEAERQALPLVPPDDDDLIRPAAEEELGRVADTGRLADTHSLSLAKHLLWTFGPDHRALPFLLQLRVEIEDDQLVSVDPEVGWLHQGIEKALEHAPWHESLRLVEQLHPHNAVGHQLAWVLAVERLCGVAADVPHRAQQWRVVMAEMSRIVEHVRVLGSLVLLHAGRRAQRVFVDAERRVATLLEIAAFVDGRFRARVGGLVADVPEGFVDTLRRELPEALSPMHTLAQQQRRLPGLLDTLRGLGVVDARAAMAHGFTGPALRACGLEDDVRVRDPYFAYDELVPRVPTLSYGDARARFRVRLEEVLASSALLLRTLAALDEGGEELALDDDAVPTDDDGQLAPPPGRAAASVEVAGGELSLVLVSDGGPSPARARVRTPSFPLCAALGRLLVGARLDEVVLILHSLGMVGNEIDR
jgi:NADH-quinone oxidoreductase subunit D